MHWITAKQRGRSEVGGFNNKLVGPFEPVSCCFNCLSYLVQVKGVSAGDVAVVQMKTRSKSGAFLPCEDLVRRWVWFVQVTCTRAIERFPRVNGMQNDWRTSFSAYGGTRSLVLDPTAGGRSTHVPL